MIQLNPKARRPRRHQVAAVNKGLDPGCQNPLFVAPTGSGKTVVFSLILARRLRRDPRERALVVAHNGSLVRQAEAELLRHLPAASVGVYSAAVGGGRREAGRPVTVGTIQSVYRRAAELGPFGLLIIDEAHRATADEAEAQMYPRLIRELRAANPALLVFGFTATPWRVGGQHIARGDEGGPATGGERGPLFDRVVDLVTIDALIASGDLCHLTSKATDASIDTAGLRTQGGDFEPGRLAERASLPEVVRAAVAELCRKGADRRRWLVFAAGVAHAELVRAELAGHGIAAAVVTGETPDAERQRVEARLESGELRCLINVDVYAEGFDVRPIDLVAMLRPTRSVSRYVQMVGRGARPDPRKRDCLVLDFAGNVRRFGPLNDLAVRFDRPAAAGSGEQPTKACPGCGEILSARTTTCPACGLEQPAAAPHGETAAELEVVREARHRPAKATYTLDDVRRWAEAYRAKHGKWPSQHSKEEVSELPGKSWKNVNAWLNVGRCGLPGGFSLAQLCPYEQHRTICKRQITEADVIGWAKRHFSKLGTWPARTSGPVEGETFTWQHVDDYLRAGCCGLPGGSSIRQLLGLRKQPLTVAMIGAWATSHRERTGKWPTCKDATVIPEATDAINWRAVNGHLVRGHRGLPGGTTLPKLLKPLKASAGRMEMRAQRKTGGTAEAAPPARVA